MSIQIPINLNLSYFSFVLIAHQLWTNLSSFSSIISKRILLPRYIYLSDVSSQALPLLSLYIVNQTFHESLPKRAELSKSRVSYFRAWPGGSKDRQCTPNGGGRRITVWYWKIRISLRQDIFLCAAAFLRKRIRITFRSTFATRSFLNSCAARLERDKSLYPSSTIIAQSIHVYKHNIHIFDPRSSIPIRPCVLALWQNWI